MLYTWSAETDRAGSLRVRRRDARCRTGIRRHDARGGHRAGAGREGPDAASLRAEQGEKLANKARTSSSPAALRWHPFFTERVLGRRLHAGRGLHALTSAPTTRSTCAAATRLPATSASRPSSRAPRLFNRARHAVGARRLARSDAGRLLRHRHRHDRRTTERTISSSSRTPRRLLPSGRRAARCCCRAALECRSGPRSPARGASPSVETIYTPDDAARSRRRGHLPPHAGHGRLRLAHLARLHAARRLLRRDGPRLH